MNPFRIITAILGNWRSKPIQTQIPTVRENSKKESSLKEASSAYYENSLPSLQAEDRTIFNKYGILYFLGQTVRGDSKKHIIVKSKSDDVHKVIDPWQIGKILENKYEIWDVKSGGMGNVYIVYDRTLCRFFALKTPKPDASSQNKIDFSQEVRVMLSVKGSDNCVTGYFAKEINSRPCLFMEYIKGCNLNQLGYLDLKSSIDLAIQFCSGMGYLHEYMGIVHLDIKPANILVTENGLLKITDFGIGDFFVPNGLGTSRQDSESETQPKEAGTFPYMSPEQWTGEHIGKWCDIYSFGIVLYKMLTGRLPFFATERLVWKTLHMQKIPDAPISINSAIPQKLSDLTLKCLEKNRNQRPSDFYDIYSQLIEIDSLLSGKSLVVEILRKNERTIKIREFVKTILSFFLYRTYPQGITKRRELI